MLSKEEFQQLALNVFHWCEYPAVKYKILYYLLDYPYNSQELIDLRKEYLESDIVKQLYDTQLTDGSWGPLKDKDYSVKSVFPTTFVALDRCMYIGLTLEDKDILLMALEYLEDILKGTSNVRLYDKNERAIPWQLCDIASYVERIKPNNSLCDRLWNEWFYISSRAFENGEYSYEKDKQAQHEVLLTREKRLVPIPLNLLLTRVERLPKELHDGLLHHYGKTVYEKGYFWDKSLNQFPDVFVSNKTRRWLPTIQYINRFCNTKEYLEDAMVWLLENKNLDGLWDYGPQVKDPWGYFNYLSTNRNYKYNRVVDCTLEVLSIFKTYLDHNGIM